MMKPLSLTLNLTMKRMMLMRIFYLSSSEKGLFGKKNLSKKQTSSNVHYQLGSQKINQFQKIKAVQQSKQAKQSKHSDQLNKEKNKNENIHKSERQTQAKSQSKKSSFLNKNKKIHQEQEHSKQQIEENKIQHPESQGYKNQRRSFDNKYTKNTQKQKSSYNHQSCEMILFRFKDIAKQSKNTRSLIASFDEYVNKLKENKVDETNLRQKYKSIMYSAMMRTFARILRRENNPDRMPMIEFLGENFENVSQICLDDLRTLELSDFVSFFFLFEMVGKYRSISEEKSAVVERYLSHLYDRYKKNKGMSASENEKEFVDEQKMQKRYLSQLVQGCRCAQLFESKTYQLYLGLLMEHIKQSQLNPYKMVVIVKFILRGENISSIEMELNLLEKIIDKIQTQTVLEDMDDSSLRELYGNLVSIANNNKFMFDMSKLYKTIEKIEEFVGKRVDRMSADDVYLVSYYALKCHCTQYKLARNIYHKVLMNINEKGQTSLNPFFVLMLLSNLNNTKESLNPRQIDPLIQQKVVSLINCYLVGEPLVHLRYCWEHLNRLIKNFSKSSISQLLIKLLRSNKLIIPYDHQSLLLQKHALSNPENKINIYASILRLKNSRSNTQQKMRLYDNIFHALEQLILPEEKNQLLQKYKSYIQSVEEIKRNRQGYVYTLAECCFVLRKEELINELFYESLLQIIQYSIQHPKVQSKSFKFNAQNNKNISSRTLSIFDHKSKEKLHALISNYILVLMEMKLETTQKGILDGFESMIQKDKFMQLIGSMDELKSIFLEVLSSRDTGQMIFYNGDRVTVRYLMRLLNYLITGPQNSLKQGDRQEQSELNEKIYLRYYEMLKNYPRRALKDVILVDESQQIISKILRLDVTNQQIDQLVNNQQPINKQSDLRGLVYDSQKDRVYLNHRHLVYLRTKVINCINK